MSFQHPGFQYPGFQVTGGVAPSRDAGSAPPSGRRRYEIRGRWYYLTPRELVYLLNKLLRDGDKKPAKKAKRSKKAEPIRVRVPAEWDALEASVQLSHMPQIADLPIWRELMAEAKDRDYQPMMRALEWFRRRRELNEDEDIAILMLYG